MVLTLKLINNDCKVPKFKHNKQIIHEISSPDILLVDSISGNDSHFLVMFCVEVNSGFLSTKLPAELIHTTELKLRNSYQWQPLQTFVTISKHFMVKAKGIRFWGTIDDCNSIMQQLLYHVSELLQHTRLIMKLCFSFLAPFMIHYMSNDFIHTVGVIKE